MTFNEFITANNGKPLEVVDPSNKNMCVDLMYGFVRDVLQRPVFSIPPALYAKNIFINFAPNIEYDKIMNSPTNVPVRGDIVFWKWYWWVTGFAGHVAVFDHGDVNYFWSFDQNYPTGSPCHFQRHSYAGVMGWIHAKGVTI